MRQNYAILVQDGYLGFFCDFGLEKLYFIKDHKIHRLGFIQKGACLQSSTKHAKYRA